MPRLLKNIYYVTIIYFINQAFTDEVLPQKIRGARMFRYGSNRHQEKATGDSYGTLPLLG
ncbi:hypothetical protein HMPREF1015_01209 [Bacillus smithii 7_3_47FAA]|uniref:Uncharacterized protein n=1 Tax=Bacillus smithii 7_3_47FAA TaxID=665952 RepID=G9QHF0_9BACI|nr:hypothetical protein HMPREF1015_01209 [Bacillus smithii 7_3_47FAA]